MPSNLFIIEAPGKREGLSGLLWRAGIRDAEVMATVGHIGTNPQGFQPLGIDAQYRETEYRLKPDKGVLAMKIGAAAKAAKKIYLATDDDQEGDVIARDVLRFCIDPEDHAKAVRTRLKALAPSELKAAVDAAEPFDPMAAVRGDARRVLDRLIGALSSREAAVGRVQGSLLLTLAELHPVVGVATVTMPSDDGKGDWIATAPVYAGQPVPETPAITVVARVGKSFEATLASQAMNHDDVLLSASLATGEPVERVSQAMQTLYERGQMTYPRAKDRAVSPDAFRRLQALARVHGAGFDEHRFKAVRAVEGEHAHEAPNPTVLDLPLNRQNALLSMEERVLVHVARNLIECGMPCQYQTPRLVDVAALPGGLAKLAWHRMVPAGERLWEPGAPAAGVVKWTPEQSVLHLMSKCGLGRPSTIVNHVGKFIERGLVDADFALTEKGQAWTQRIGELFSGNRGLSKTVETYLELNRKPAEDMVREMITLCALDSAVGSGANQGYDDDEELEISSGHVS